MIKSIVFALCLMIASAAQAAPLPVEQSDDDTALWLARAMVAEGGWSQRDHAALAWVLVRRWEVRSKRDPNWAFLDQIRAYCAGMRGEARTERHRWLRDLRVDASQPDHWPARVSWQNYQRHWERAMAHAKEFLAGSVPDPCGRARPMHWGGAMDRVRDPDAKPVNCGFTHNIFYAYRSK